MAFSTWKHWRPSITQKQKARNKKPSDVNHDQSEDSTSLHICLYYGFIFITMTIMSLRQWINHNLEEWHENHRNMTLGIGPVTCELKCGWNGTMRWSSAVVSNHFGLHHMTCDQILPATILSRYLKCVSGPVLLLCHFSIMMFVTHCLIHVTK